MEPTPRSATLSAILLDDDSSQAYLLTRLLEEVEDVRIHLTHYSTQSQAMADLLSQRADLIFLDHNLGEPSTGLDLMRSLREWGYDGAIVMLTGSDDEKLVAEFLQFGADAYICKGDLEPTKLSVAIRMALQLPHRQVPDLDHSSTSAWRDRA